MIKDLELSEFLEKNNISYENWEKSELNWIDLKKIGENHQELIIHLNQVAEFIANTLQKCKSVHSVRWRVKDPQHLMEKIVRKKIEGIKKYEDINYKNYSEKVTDLVGVRVLHLFKDERVDIERYIKEKWNLIEKIVYIRKGDDKIENSEEHPHGYRSIHYVISSQPTLNKVFSEIQVRTIFEEGWSEIDHKIRYPNYSDNYLISYFLKIFNRMAGTSDEMGSFLKNLVQYTSEQEATILEADRKNNKLLNDIEFLISKMNNNGEELDELNSKIKELRTAELSGGYLKILEKNYLNQINSFLNTSDIDYIFDIKQIMDKANIKNQNPYLDFITGSVNPQKLLTKLAKTTNSNLNQIKKKN